MSGSVIEIHGAVQQYQWGKIGKASKVATLSENANQDFELKSNEPYAELWMGAHIKAPSMIGDESLLEFIKENPQTLGSKVIERYGELPFLFKVLSVAKSLSIQAHPNKKLAEKLFAERPDVYKDPNHKPEMAIALTQFEALCGFRPLEEIINFLNRIPELEDVVGKDTADKLRAKHEGSLKDCFSNVILCDKAKLDKNLNSLSLKFDRMSNNDDDMTSLLGELYLRLHSQFGNDIGCFVIYFLNHISLSPGEAIFLGANIPHAYLSGDCIECMACSDNVVRAGLTPKLVDAPTLCEMLNYNPSTSQEQNFKPEKSNDKCELIYNPPVDDFAVVKVCVPQTLNSYQFAIHESASIVLFIEGSANAFDIRIKPGVILFVPSNTLLELRGINIDVVAYRATCFL